MGLPPALHAALAAIPLASLLATLPAQGAADVAAAPSATGVVRGVVFDSLLGAPLAGAHVSAGDRAAVTDREGRYAMDGVPAGRRVVTFAHPGLDSIGLSSLGAAVEVAAGGETRVDLATPSFTRLWRAACGDSAGPAPPDRGFAFGSVRDAETGDRLEGATVVLSWLALGENERGKLGAEWPVVMTRSDATGMFYACGVASGTSVSAQAFAGEHFTGETELALGPRRIARRDFAVSREAIAAAGDGAGAARAAEPVARRGLAAIAGTVLDESGRPLAAALVTIAGAAGEARTGESGRFALGGLPSGTQTLEVRLLGFGASRQPVELRNRDTATVTVELRKATVLGAVEVKVPALARRVAEIEQRHRTGLGHLMRADEVRRRPTLRAALAEVPSVHIMGSGPHDYRIMLPSNAGGMGNTHCAANVFIDDFPAAQEQATAIPPKDIAAIEVYPRPSEVPMRYQRVADGCGVVLIWTTYVR
jgi:hypothetical protein